MNLRGIGYSQHSFKRIFVFAFAIFLYNSLTFAAGTSTGTVRITPSSGSTAGGTIVTIFGHNLTNIRSIAIGSKRCPLISRKARRLSCLTPASTEGEFPISIMWSKGRRSKLKDIFTYTAVTSPISTSTPIVQLTSTPASHATSVQPTIIPPRSTTPIPSVTVTATNTPQATNTSGLPTPTITPSNSPTPPLSPSATPTPTSTSAHINCSLLSLANEPLLKDGLYRHPSSFIGATSMRADGAVGSCNYDYEDGKRSTFCVQNQRWGGDRIAVGVIKNDAVSLAMGWKLFQWGIDPDRTGTASQYGQFVKDADEFHSVGFFLEAMTRAGIIMQQSGDASYQSMITELQPIAQGAANYIAFGNVPSEASQGGRFTHRDYKAGAALLEASRFLGVESWTNSSAQFINYGLNRQFSDGTNPEQSSDGLRYDFDVNYQAAGALFAARYYCLTNDENLKTRLKTMIDKALTKEITKIDPSTGAIFGGDSTRVCHEYSNNGVFKTPEESTITEALIAGYVITGNELFKNYAQLITDKSGWATGGNNNLGYCS